MPFEVSRKLKQEMDEKLDSHEADEDHLRNAEAAYLELAEYYRWEKISCFIDNKNARDVEEIHKNILKIINALDRI